MTSGGARGRAHALHWGMLARLNAASLLRLAGLFTWATVAMPILLMAWQAVPAGEGAVQPMPWMGWVAWGVFGGCYLWLTQSLGMRRTTVVDLIALVVLTTSAGAVGYFTDSGLGSILLTVVAYLLPWRLPLAVGVGWLVASQLAMVPVFSEGLDFPVRESFMLAILYAGFSGFVFVTSLVARQQLQSREEQRRLNSELRATRALLAESVRVNERTRISRELHDLLGHHLTALSLNLEVASHLATGKAQEHVTQAHTLAKLLLSDVREAVSQIRDSDAIDMAATLLPLADNVPGLRIDMRLPAPFLLDDAERAHVLLRCTQEIITNVVRHAHATTLELRYRWTDGGLQLDASDNGRGADALVAGNGLRGMRERLQAYGGDVQVDTRPGDGFRLKLVLPLEPASRPSGQPLRAAPPAPAEGAS